MFLFTYLKLNLNLWLEEVLSNEPGRNHEYGISSTTVKDLRMTQSVSTILD